MKKLVALLSLGTLFCAGQGDIDRTQPNKLPKGLFQGTWYLRSTVTDVPSTSVMGFVGIDSDIEKLIWEIQEDYLIAWRAYEELPGANREAIDEVETAPFHTEPAEGRDVGRVDGYADNPIAAFPITEHFDVKRQYNAATGEQTNVIEENSTDRPWYEREYIRVDWTAQQLSTGFRYFGPVGSVDLQYYVQQNEGGEDAFRILAKGADAEGNATDVPLDFDNVLQERPDPASAYYIDMGGRLFVEPAMATFYRFGYPIVYQFPLCWYYPAYSPALGVSCGATYMEVRTSLLKVPDEYTGYEPGFMDDRDMGRFGYFRTERLTYNRQRGITETGRIYLANRHNIWERSYECVEDDGGNCQLDETGQIVWATDDMGEKIPMAMADRTPKPIVYHLSPQYPADLLAVTKDIGREWNRVVRRAVAMAKGCLTDTTMAVDDVPTAPPPDEGCWVPDMFLVNGNGWTEDVGDEDGPQPYLNYRADGTYSYDPARYVARYGDIRFNFLAWVDNPQLRGPHGFGPSSADPETGQIVTGNAYVYGAVTDRAAQNALDIVRVLNGDLDIDDLVDSDYVRSQIEGNLTPVDPRNLPAEIRDLPSGSAAMKLLGPDRLQKLETAKEWARTDKLANANPLWEAQRLNMVRGTPAEQWAYNDEIVRELLPAITGEGIDPGGSVPPLATDAQQQIDPLMQLGPEMIAFEKYRWEWASKNNIWLEEFTDNAVMGLALQYRGRSDYDQIWRELRDTIYESVMLHEIGHTVGLRHNFAGSYDSVNYFDRYWDLREDNLLHKSPADATWGEEIGQYQMTDPQKAGKMNEFEYSTVMDYPSRFNGDIHGLGKYDAAAVAFGYTGYVEAFDPDAYVAAEWDRLAADERFENNADADLVLEDPQAQADRIEYVTTNLRNTLWLRLSDCTGMFEERSSPGMRSPVEVFHYTQLPDMLFGDRSPVLPDDYTNESWRGYRYRKFMPWPEMRAEIEATRERCERFVETAGVNCDPDQIYYGGSECGSLVSDQWGVFNECNNPDEDGECPGGAGSREYRQVLVPYQFCGDEYAGSVQACNRWDRGADPYEQVMDRIDAYHNYFWFTHFKRDRANFNPIQVMQTVFGRYFSYLVGAYQQFLISPIWDDMLYDYWLFAWFAGFDELLSVVSKPEMGSYEFNDDNLTWEPAGWTGGDANQTVFLDRGPAKRAWSDWSWDDGYYFYSKPREVGHFYDFVAGIFALTQATASVVNLDRGNVGSYYLPYYLVLDDDLHRTFEGIFAEAYDQYAPRLIGGTPKYVMNGVPLTDGSTLDPVTWDVVDPPEGGFPVATMSSISFRYYPLLYGMAFFPVWDNQFLYRNRVMIAGSGEDMTVGDGWTLESCTDPETGVAYTAGCDPTWSDDESGGACKMITRCQQLAAECDGGECLQSGTPCCDLDWLVLFLDMQRSVYNAFQSGFW